MEVEIGRGKKGRRAYGFDDIAIVPSRRTRDPDDVDISWTLGPYRFELPLLASAMDGVVSPATALELGRLGGLGVLNLEGIWSRYEDADEQLAQIAAAPPEHATQLMQEIYEEPLKPELIAQRVEEIKAAGAVAAGSLTPQRVTEYYEVALEAGLDILVIQGTVISAEHVSPEVRAAQPEGVHRRGSGPVRRRRLRLLLDRPAPDAHRRRRRPRRGRPRRRLHHPRRARDRRPAGDRDRRRRRGPLAAHARDRRVLQRDRRRRHADRRRRLEGDRLRRRRGDDRLAAGPRQGGARARLPLGDGDLPPVAAARHPGRDRSRTGRSRRSCSAPRTRTTAPST